MIVALVLVALLGLVVYWLLTTKKDPKGAPKLYSEFPYIPWLGSIVQFAQEPRDFLLRAQAKMGEVFDIQLFGQKMTFLMSTEGHDFFFQQPEADFDASAAYKFTVTTFGPGVVYDAPPKIMYQQFGFFRFGLDAKKYVSYTRLIQEETAEYFDTNWGSSGTGCVFTALNELFTFTSARCLLGPEIRALWKADYAEAYQDLDKSFIPILFFFPNMPHPFAKKCLAARKHFEKLFLSVLESRRADPDGQFDDFLQVLIESNYKDGTPLSIQEVTGIMMGVLLGGQHTSNVTGTWLLLHLLESKEWRDRVLAEQREIMGSDGQGDFATYDQVAQMKVLDQCLQETLRLHPPFFQLARRVTRDVLYKDTVIPEGRLVCISPGATMRLPSLFPDASTFDPSRFDGTKSIENHAFVPFGGGRHICTGRKFALTSIKTAVSWMLRNYEFETPEKLPLPDYTTMVVAPSHTKGQCKVRYTKK